MTLRIREMTAMNQAAPLQLCLIVDIQLLVSKLLTVEIAWIWATVDTRQFSLENTNTLPCS
jgi:hypothetical protein